jgi:hypothetical protein
MKLTKKSFPDRQIVASQIEGRTMFPLTIQDTIAMSDWNVVSRFMTETYSPSYIMRNTQLFEWQFSRSQHQGVANMVCAYDEGSLVGILGYIPVDMFWGNKEKLIQGAWMANWMVHPSHRKGVGPLLMRRLMELYPVLLGQGAGIMNVPIARTLGFRVFPKIPRFIAIFDHQRTRQFLTSPDCSLPDVLTTRTPFLHIERGLSDEYNPDWGRYSDLQFASVRNAEYLNWRYVNHPLFSYYILIAGEPTEPTVCVYRLEQTKGVVVDCVGRIVELFFPDGRDGEILGREILSAALYDMQQRGCAFVDCYFSSSRGSQAVIEAGMFDATDLALATRLSPVELNHHPQNLEMWVKSGFNYPDDLAKLYVTKSDGDQDRPN